jgi:hypothetical protein
MPNATERFIGAARERRVCGPIETSKAMLHRYVSDERGLRGARVTGRTRAEDCLKADGSEPKGDSEPLQQIPLLGSRERRTRSTYSEERQRRCEDQKLQTCTALA